MPPWLSPLCLVLEKNVQFSSLVFLEVQEINLRSNMRGSKCNVNLENVFDLSRDHMIDVSYDFVGEVPSS